MFVVTLLAFSMPITSLAEFDAMPVVGGVLDFLSGIPKVGPILVQVIKYAGAAAGILTALSLFVQGVLAALSGVLNVAKFQGLADKLKKFSDFIVPKLKYFSMFNVQKKLG
jgi:hypothetical protein